MIIAEAGVNHNGDIELAKRLIDAAADAGADLVKFQTFNSDELVSKNAPKADYQIPTTGNFQSQLAMLRQLELNRKMHEILLHIVVIVLSSFSHQVLTLRASIISFAWAKRFKIPSGEIVNLPYLRHVGGFGKPIILSTGMATFGEIESALEVLEGAGTSRQQITILHCNTEYPTPIKDVNLHAMCSIRDAFSVSVGYSDHSPGIEVPIAAVALGATVIEKHLTLDRNLPGPDHKASLEPKEFKAMVSSIHKVQLALGDGIKRPSPSEAKNKQPCVNRWWQRSQYVQENNSLPKMLA